MSDHISSIRLSVQGPFLVSVSEPWASCLIQRGSAAFQRNSVVFREVQFRVIGPSCIFSESTHFQQFILYISYGPYEGWVPCSASGEI